MNICGQILMSNRLLFALHFFYHWDNFILEKLLNYERSLHVKRIWCNNIVSNSRASLGKSLWHSSLLSFEFFDIWLNYFYSTEEKVLSRGTWKSPKCKVQRFHQSLTRAGTHLLLSSSSPLPQLSLHVTVHIWFIESLNAVANLHLLGTLSSPSLFLSINSLLSLCTSEVLFLLIFVSCVI